MNLITIITILSIILILAFLVYIYFDIRKLMKKKDFIIEKDVVNNVCPDFFELDPTKNEDYCKNVYNLGSGQDFDGSPAVYKDITKSDEAKCNWSRMNRVSWEGIDRLC